MSGSDFHFVVHDATDAVGVAINDLKASKTAKGVTLDRSESFTITLADDVPLGHKVALRDIPAGAQVEKYGVAIGTATEAIPTGSHVHTHNLRSDRWRES